MDKETRNRIQRATQAARRLLEQECAAQLEGIFDILPDGTINLDPGAHLGDADRITRAKIVAAIEHRRAGGMAKAASVADYVREAAFTILNRFVALKMLEARGLILESRLARRAVLGLRRARPPGARPRRPARPRLPALPRVPVRRARPRDRRALRPARPREPALAPAPAVHRSPRDPERPRARRGLAGGRDHRLGLPVLQRRGRAPPDARRIGGPAQQPRARRAQPVLHAALRRPVPDRQHAGPHLVRDAPGAHPPRRQPGVPGPEAQRSLPGRRRRSRPRTSRRRTRS